MKQTLSRLLVERLSAIRGFGMRQYILRAVLALATLLTLVYLAADVPLTSKEFYSDAQLFTVLLFASLLFLLLLLVSSDRAVGIALLGVLLLWFYAAAAESADYYLAFGLTAVIAAVVFLADVRLPRLALSRKWLWATVAVLGVGMTLFIGVLTALRYREYWTPTYDFGIFAQMFHYMKETGQCLTTCERDGLLSHFAVHFSPIYYLLLPLYALIPTPETLLVAQGLIVASGLIPLVLLCRRLSLSRAATLGFAVLYTCYPALLEANFFYLHENCFLAPCLLWLLYCMERGDLWPSLGVAGLTLLIKEDAAVYVAVIGLYFLAARKKPKNGLLVLLVAVAYFLAVTRLMGIFGEGVMSDSRYGDYIYDGGGLFTVIKAVLQNPLYAIRQIFRAEKVTFLLQMLLPLAFLPLAFRRPERLLLLIPLLLVNLMTSYVYQFDIAFQYVYGSGAILLYLAVANFAELREGLRGRALLLALLAAILIFGAGPAQRFGFVESYAASEKQRDAMGEALALIPEDADVAATTFLVTNLSARRVVYELETTVHASEVEYIVIDRRYDTDAYFRVYEGDPTLERIFYEPGLVAIYQRIE